MKSKSFLLMLVVLLIGIMAAPVNASDYDSPDIVKAVQSALNSEGYNCGNADGDAGSNTRAQIAAYRKDRHIGESSDIDGALLWALGLTDEPYWLPFQSDEDLKTVTDHLTEEYDNMVAYVLFDIGADLKETYDAGNFVQYGSGFEFGLRIISDNNSLLLITATWDDAWYPVCVCNYDTGEYYYKDENVFNGESVSKYDVSTIQPSALLANGTDTRVINTEDINVSKDNGANETPEPEQYQEPINTDTSYVLNTNTKKFHYPSCSSAADIKPSNRKDYVGTREEVIAMGYEPCKRCNP